MADRGILFSAPMVRALLDGRKAQTRRMLKPGKRPALILDGAGILLDPSFAPPVFHIGDQLWVREAWRSKLEYDHLPGSEMPQMKSLVEYDLEVRKHGSREAGRLRPGMFMPRWASRLTLTVTDLRVERIQQISERDAIAEGVQASGWEGDDVPGHARIAYRDLWNSLHDKPDERWEDNPWVVVISFDVRRGNIDGVEYSEFPA